MSILSGLGKFGLGDLEGQKLYGDKTSTGKKNNESAETVTKAPEEADFLYEKKYTCPVCGEEFTALTIRTGKVHVKKVDMDLKPNYEQVDEIKYDIIACPDCGYAALGRYFNGLTARQIDEVRNKICMHYKAQKEQKNVYTYKDARERYQLALANAIVKNAKDSEKAYLCLKTAWLIRGETASFVQGQTPDYETRKAQNDEEEMELLKNALDGLVLARQKEDFPIAGMNTMTLDYLLAALYLETGQYDYASKMIGEILVSRTANSHMKDRARDLKDQLDKKKAAAKK